MKFKTLLLNIGANMTEKQFNQWKGWHLLGKWRFLFYYTLANALIFSSVFSGLDFLVGDAGRTILNVPFYLFRLLFFIFFYFLYNLYLWKKREREYNEFLLQSGNTEPINEQLK
jgi:hypothetical protein